MVGAIVAPVPMAQATPEPDAKYVFTGQAMGTVITVYMWTDDEARAARAAQAVFEEMKRLDGVMTTWTPDSEVSKINAAAGVAPVAVSAETFAVIERAQDVAIKSRGVFDITVGAFKGLWKFDQDMDGTLPAPADVQRRLRLIGYRHTTSAYNIYEFIVGPFFDKMSCFMRLLIVLTHRIR
jgi:thiamine biosynthesis lipoprotein